MHYIEFAEDRGSVGGQDHFGKVVYNDLVAPIRTKGGLHGLRNGAAGVNLELHQFLNINVKSGQIYVANDCSIFSVVAVVTLLEQSCLRGLRYRE
jgi:hypothetical protein